jgi:hypothetical protein
MYKFSVYSFSSKEIDQICELVKRWSHGDVFRPVDARKLTKQVKDYAANWNLLEKRNGRLFIKSASSWNNVTPGIFNVVHNLPVEVLWRLVQPMLKNDTYIGYSIVNSKLWYDLGIAPQNDRHVTDVELQEKEDILLKLSCHHYINFQMAGSVWGIYVEERVA